MIHLYIDNQAVTVTEDALTTCPPGTLIWNVSAKLWTPLFPPAAPISQSISAKRSAQAAARKLDDTMFCIPRRRLALSREDLLSFECDDERGAVELKSSLGLGIGEVFQVLSEREPTRRGKISYIRKTSSGIRFELDWL